MVQEGGELCGGEVRQLSRVGAGHRRGGIHQVLSARHRPSTAGLSPCRVLDVAGNWASEDGNAAVLHGHRRLHEAVDGCQRQRQVCHPCVRPQKPGRRGQPASCGDVPEGRVRYQVCVLLAWPSGLLGRHLPGEQNDGALQIPSRCRCGVARCFGGGARDGMGAQCSCRHRGGAGLPGAVQCDARVPGGPRYRRCEGGLPSWGGLNAFPWRIGGQLCRDPVLFGGVCEEALSREPHHQLHVPLVGELLQVPGFRSGEGMRRLLPPRCRQPHHPHRQLCVQQRLPRRVGAARLGHVSVGAPRQPPARSGARRLRRRRLRQRQAWAPRL
mmetsp:Transcript_632/g.1553  ORF Transcript_632/g.1553 Transcript_632/m.1553 type:complete len:327 (-) Transcript_632:879-1859(-)